MVPACAAAFGVLNSHLADKLFVLGVSTVQPPHLAFALSLLCVCPEPVLANDRLSSGNLWNQMNALLQGTFTMADVTMAIQANRLIGNDGFGYAEVRYN